MSEASLNHYRENRLVWVSFASQVDARYPTTGMNNLLRFSGFVSLAVAGALVLAGLISVPWPSLVPIPYALLFLGFLSLVFLELGIVLVVSGNSDSKPSLSK